MTPGEPTVTIVSGLPRSGTSLVMQMLAAGGLPILTDRQRGADPDNPRGYFELEAAKRTRDDPSWLAMAAGKGVKVVSPLLADLPPGYRYRVVFLRRDIDEVIASQRAMLRRQGKPGAALTDEQLAEVYRAQLRRLDQWLPLQERFSVLDVRHGELIRDPVPTSVAIREFLGVPLDVEAMAGQVDPSLHRQRGGPR